MPSNAEAARAVAGEISDAVAASIRPVAARAASLCSYLREFFTPPPDYAAFCDAHAEADSRGLRRFALATLPVPLGICLRLGRVAVSPYLACLALPMLLPAALAACSARSPARALLSSHQTRVVFACAVTRYAAVGAVLMRSPSASGGLPRSNFRMTLLSVLDTLVAASMPLRWRPKAAVLLIRAAAVCAPASWALWPDVGARGEAFLVAAAAVGAAGAAAAERAALRAWRRGVAEAAAGAAAGAKGKRSKAE